MLQQNFSFYSEFAIFYPADLEKKQLNFGGMIYYITVFILI